MKLIICLFCLALVAGACGSSSDSGPAAPSTLVNIAGSWNGNLQSSNYPPVLVVVQLSQSGAAVTGTWTVGAVDLGFADWNGTVSGTMDGATFTGTLTISAALGGGPRCTGNATVAGLNATTLALRWTSPGFTGSCAGEPAGMAWNLGH